MLAVAAWNAKAPKLPKELPGVEGQSPDKAGKTVFEARPAGTTWTSAPSRHFHVALTDHVGGRERRNRDPTISLVWSLTISFGLVSLTVLDHLFCSHRVVHFCMHEEFVQPNSPPFVSRRKRRSLSTPFGSSGLGLCSQFRPCTDPHAQFVPAWMPWCSWTSELEKKWLASWVRIWCPGTGWRSWKYHHEGIRLLAKRGHH